LVFAVRPTEQRVANLAGYQPVRRGFAQPWIVELVLHQAEAPWHPRLPLHDLAGQLLPHAEPPVNCADLSDGAIVLEENDQLAREWQRLHSAS